MKKTEIPLLTAANRTVSGPQCKIGGDASVVVEYDHEADDGTISWATIAFHEVLEFRSRQAACAAADDIIGSHEMACFQDSPLLRETMNRWEAAVGWQKSDQGSDGRKRFSHYKLYFDDAAALDIVAADHTILPEVN